MNESLSSEQYSFRKAEGVCIDGAMCENSVSDPTIVYVADMTLDLREARQLRDWLDKVIP